jgi:5,10-methylenetetrahydrofolate reductase
VIELLVLPGQTLITSYVNITGAHKSTGTNIEADLARVIEADDDTPLEAIVAEADIFDDVFRIVEGQDSVPSSLRACVFTCREQTQMTSRREQANM